MIKLWAYSFIRSPRKTFENEKKLIFCVHIIHVCGSDIFFRFQYNYDEICFSNPNFLTIHEKFSNLWLLSNCIKYEESLSVNKMHIDIPTAISKVQAYDIELWVKFFNDTVITCVLVAKGYFSINCSIICYFLFTFIPVHRKFLFLSLIEFYFFWNRKKLLSVIFLLIRILNLYMVAEFISKIQNSQLEYKLLSWRGENTYS